MTGSSNGITDAGKLNQLSDWTLYDYEEDGQFFTVVQPSSWERKDDLREDGSFEHMNRKGRFLIPTNKFRDVILVPSITAQMFEKQRKTLKLRSGDIVIATFPRSGTTWTEQLVLLLLSKGDPLKLNTAEKNSYDPNVPERPGKVFLDALYHKNPTGNIAAPWGLSFGNDLVMTQESLDELPFRRVFKTHHRAHMQVGLGAHWDLLDSKSLPPLENSGVKFLWVIRDPKDVMLSMMKINTTNYEKHGFPTTAFAKAFLAGRVNRGSWADHAREWRQFANANPDNVLPLTYEGNKKDPLGNARKVAQFLDIQLTEEELKRCVELSSFDAMREMSKNAPAQHIVHGRVGRWRERLSDDVIEGFNQMVSDPSLGDVGKQYLCPLGDRM